MKLKELKKGDFFTRKAIAEPGESHRSQGKYECVRFDDANRFAYLKGTAEVHTDFVF